jgi:uncharacterized Zn finger protein
MSRWNREGWYPTTPKQPAPAHGIKLKQVGTTWWGQCWIQALERISVAYSSRLARGRTYARAGRTHDLVVENGTVRAKVTGSRPTPYKVTIELKRISDAAWNQAIAAMTAKAQFSAELLAGQMPREIDLAFRSGNASLFPTQAGDLTTHCNCPDSANPCKHIAATHYVLGEAFDRDPFLLFELRGRSKDQVLALLRTARSGEAGARTSRAPRAKPSAPSLDGVEIPRVTLAKVKSAEYDHPRAAWPPQHLVFAAPVIRGSVLRQLGDPPSWANDQTPVDLLGPLFAAGADLARRIALAECEPQSTQSRNPAPICRKSR